MSKATRKIVVIDEDKCDGCGQCASACVEGAIRIIDGKARLVSETYCDGLGACLGTCPRDAITIEERSAEQFDELAVKQHLADLKTQSPSAAAPGGGCPGTTLRVLDTQSAVPSGGCPGSAIRELTGGQSPSSAPSDAPPPSALAHWPIQLRLVPTHAPFLQGADILVCADCVPFVVPDFHSRYLATHAVLVGCPKFDDMEFYREKLQQIVAAASPASLTVLRMEVPCCGPIAQAVLEARDAAAPQLPVEIHTIGIQGGTAKQISPASE